MVAIHTYTVHGWFNRPFCLVLTAQLKDTTHMVDLPPPTACLPCRHQQLACPAATNSCLPCRGRARRPPQEPTPIYHRCGKLKGAYGDRKTMLSSAVAPLAEHRVVGLWRAPVRTFAPVEIDILDADGVLLGVGYAAQLPWREGGREGGREGAGETPAEGRASKNERHVTKKRASHGTRASHVTSHEPESVLRRGIASSSEKISNLALPPLPHAPISPQT